MKKTMSIEGMTCNHCVMRVKKALEAVGGVASVDVQLESRKALIELSAEVDTVLLRNAVEKIGYGVGEIK